MGRRVGHALPCIAAAACITGCAEEPIDDGPERYAEACEAALRCFIPCEADEVCIACIEGQGAERLGLAAAYDAAQCGLERCPELCAGPSDYGECTSCLKERCPEPMAACGGSDPEGYELGQGEPYRTCLEVRECFGSCRDDDQCSRCYWDARPLARLSVWKLTALLRGACAEACFLGPGDRCESCIEAWAPDRGIEDCLASP